MTPFTLDAFWEAYYRTKSLREDQTLNAADVGALRIVLSMLRYATCAAVEFHQSAARERQDHPQKKSERPHAPA